MKIDCPKRLLEYNDVHCWFVIYVCRPYCVSLCRDELSEQLELKRKEKKKMRKKLKKFEDDFFEQTGR